MYSVYKIDVNGITRYIGYTKSLKVRQTQHRYMYKKGLKKLLYNNLRQLYGDDYKIELIEIRSFKSKVESRRFEALLILTDWFGGRSLWQYPPVIKM